MFQAGPVSMHFLMRVEEFLLASGLYPNPHGVEGGHDVLPVILFIQSCLMVSRRCNMRHHHVAGGAML